MSARPRRILQVSPRDVGGGAEKVALELHHAYIAAGLDAHLAVGTRSGDDPGVIELPRPAQSAWTRRLLAYADGLANGQSTPSGARWALDRGLRTLADPRHMSRVQKGLEDFDHPGTATIPSLVTPAPDLIHLHNLHGDYFDIRALPALSAARPTILTMHDVWTLTGHCAYPLTCERWRVGCGQCPDLTLPVAIRRDASAQNCRIKRIALSTSSSLRVATPSRWLTRMVEESGLSDKLAETRTIPNGVDTDVFSPGDKAKARQALGLPQDATIVLFAANAAKSSPFKGFETLAEALSGVVRAQTADGVVMVALGEQAPEGVIGGVPVHFVPFARDPQTVARYYRAADLYVHPALAESFGLAIAEAMACGLAVVASDVGGIPEVVRDHETGLLFPVGDAAGLSRAVIALLGDRELRATMGLAGRDRATRELDFARQADAYLSWYEDILGS
ncbi:MAG: glycosyltransferase [Coriobacteriia bacterium]|nr:glycosyltransferase [Coriobacteriia bacterium]